MRTLGECPCCGIALEAIENDPDNRFKCPTKGCYFNSNPVPADVANILRCSTRLRSDTERTCESCFYSALVSKAQPCVVCTPPLWPFWKPKGGKSCGNA